MKSLQPLTPISFGSVIIFLPVSFAIVIVAYIFIGADGSSWADKPLEVVFYLSIALNIACYLSALLHHSKHYFTASAILSAMIFLIYVGALFASIPGTGDRYGNRGIDISAYIGLVCGALIFIQNYRYVIPISVALASAVFIVPVVVYFYISSPLYRAHRNDKNSEICFIQQTTYDSLNTFEDKSARRAETKRDLSLGFFISERSPRITKIEGWTESRWSYSERKFMRPTKIEKLPKVCREIKAK